MDTNSSSLESAEATSTSQPTQNDDTQSKTTVHLASNTHTVLGKGYVKLIGRYPQELDPAGTVEGSIANVARTTRGIIGGYSRARDVSLVKYLVLNQHTSPLEFVSFEFELRVPLFVAVHLLRHRTSHVNQESFRYARSDCTFFRASEYPIRVQSTANKQMSATCTDDAKAKEIKMVFEEMESLNEMVACLYEKALELGAAREVARAYLPTGTFTTLRYQMDLNNLLKLFRLRLASDAQPETCEVVTTMLELVRPVIPTIYELFIAQQQTVSFSPTEQTLIETSIYERTKIVSPYSSGTSTDLDFRRRLSHLGLECA